MAIFAPSTTSGYSDPYKALTIKALEKRQQDMMNNMAKAEVPKAETPMAVAGVGLGAIGDALQVRNVNQAAAAKRDQLSSIMAGVDPNKGPTAQQAAQIYALDNELGGRYMQNQQENARQQALFAEQRAQAAERYKQEEIARGQKDTFEKANAAQRVLDEQAAAAEKARVAEQAAAAQAEKEHSLEQARARDALILQQQKAEDDAKAAKLAAEAAAAKELTDPKRILAEKGLEKEASQERQMLEELNRAKDDLMHPGGVYTGMSSGWDKFRGNLPGVGSYIGDPEKAARTSRFDTTMEKVATTSMSQILKGATTDREMAKFIQLWNSPVATQDQKREAFKSVLAAAERDQVIGQAALDRLGSKRLIQPGVTAGDPLTEAQNAVNSGAPIEEVAKILQSKGGDPTKLKPKGS